jgi:hypothetical protein
MKAEARLILTVLAEVVVLFKLLFTEAAARDQSGICQRSAINIEMSEFLLL